MAKNDDQKFDPRFDPAFQRGFRPPKANSAERRGASVSRAVPPIASREISAPNTAAASTSAGVSPAPVRVLPVAAAPVEADGVAPDASSVTQAVSSVAQAASSGAPAFSSADPDDGENYSEVRGGIEDADIAPRNPFFTALWILGVAFTAGGVAMLAASVFALVASNPIVAYDRTMDELGIYISTPLMTVGLATIVALLFISGLRRDR